MNISSLELLHPSTKMTLKDYELLKNFNIKENWGDPLLMSKKLLFTLDFYREKIGLPMIISAGYATKGHSLRSQHGEGNAVDLVIPKLELTINNIFNLLIETFNFNFNGIGFYFGHEYKGLSVASLHLDVRSLSQFVARKKWLGIVKFNNKIEYSDMTYGNISKYCKEYNYIAA